MIKRYAKKMLKPKIVIGAERFLNRERYCMTLIEVESYERRQLSHSSLQNRLCGVFGDIVGEGYPKHRRAKNKGLFESICEVKYDGFRVNSGGKIVCWLKERRLKPPFSSPRRAKLAESSEF